MSNTYEIEIKYHIGNIPRVFVLSPKLEMWGEEKSIPHTYSSNEICVYLPNNDEWLASAFIADTIIPWTLLWLFFYEIWLATGKWFGGGIHPVRRMPYIKKNDKNMVSTVN
jgi:hypothetical protein